ncbi:hypothetical protein [Comamonas aquatica]|uniref:hypothetical protein n=1 Tax=Comamonas aquatica TaxID=225991 RepID=UPI000AC034A2|nr:hypothetical protein [Comamonas aquatica]
MLKDSFLLICERKAGATIGNDFKLAALRWPEKILQFDDGTNRATLPSQHAA